MIPHAVSAMPPHAPECALRPVTQRRALPGRAALHAGARARSRIAALALASVVLAGYVSTAAAQMVACPVTATVEKTGATITTDDRANGYAYPYRDAYLATMMAAALNPDGVTPGLKRQIVRIPVLPERNSLPYLEGRGDVSVALYRQNGPAPLLFILSGIGSNPYFGLGTYFANLFHQEGFHVVVLPSPMYWNFALAASPSGAPGYAPEDARDLYNVMQRTLAEIKSRHGVKITRVSFMGASLGALEGAYLSVIDADQRAIGIDRFLLVNPPLDVAYALDRIDAWTALQARFGQERSETLRARALLIVESYTRDKRSDPVAIERLASKFSCFSTEELQLLIAGYVQTSVPELIYVTQAIHDRQLLVTSRDRVSERLEEAKSFTLADYTAKVAIPTWSRQAGLATDGERLRNGGSLAMVLDRVRSNPKVYIMHNADDVLADRESIAELKAAMGDRMILYPLGGHLGNLWFPENRDAILALFKPYPARAQSSSIR